MTLEEYMLGRKCAEEGCDYRATHRGPTGEVCNAHIGEYGYALND